MPEVEDVRSPLMLWLLPNPTQIWVRSVRDSSVVGRSETTWERIRYVLWDPGLFRSVSRVDLACSCLLGRQREGMSRNCARR